MLKNAPDGKCFEHLAYLFDHIEKRYTWAHNLVALYYSDDQTDYPLYFQVWKSPDVERLEQGLRDIGIPLRESKLPLKASAPQKWRQYLLGVWCRQQGLPAVAALYQSKLLIVRQFLQGWVTGHPELQLPVTFDNGYTQPAFCRFIDQELHRAYVGTLAPTDQVVLKDATLTLEALATRLKGEHQAALAQEKPSVFSQISIPYKGERET